MDGSGAGSRRLSNTVTVVVCAAVVAFPWWMERAFARWWERNRPLLAFGSRYRRLQTRYRDRQDSITEWTVLVAAVAAAVAVSMPTSRPPR
jgi:hypothetical protein